MSLSSTLRIALVVLAASFASCFVAPKLGGGAQKQSFLCASNNNRREFVRTIVAGSTAILIPSIANAKDGDSAKIVLPNYVEYLIEQNKRTDPDILLLYKGPDIELQLRRIGEAAVRLPEVATLAEAKKWSQVQGIITGPLGTLLQTLNSVASIAGTKEAASAVKTVKQDLNDINAASQKKDSALCIKAAGKASVDLEKFVKIAFK